MDWPLPAWELAIEFEVLGDPKAQPRHRHYSRGKFVKVYDPAADAKDLFASVIQHSAPEEPLVGPVRVDLECYFPRPKSHYGTGRNADKLKASAPLFHIKKPDRDNLDKFVLDSMSKIFWLDDCQVCAGPVTKQYSTRPRTVVRVYKEASDEVD